MPNEGIPISWFDFAVLVVLAAGLIRGRRRGMSQDLMDLLMWIGIVVGGGFAYKPGGAYLSRLAGLSPLTANIVVYLGWAALVFVIFVFLKNAFKDKLAGTDFFGRLEYPLGMVSGMIRFFAMLMLVLALISARLVTEAERAAIAKMQQDNFGSISFPTLGEIQQSIFVRSFSGAMIHKHLGILLIVPSGAEGQNLGEKDSIGRRRERELDKVIGK